MKKSIFIAFALTLAFVGTAWGQTSVENIEEALAVTWDYTTPFVYDGGSKSVSATSNNCDGTLSLSGNTATNAGVYTAVASVACAGHDQTITDVGAYPATHYVHTTHVGSPSLTWVILRRDISKLYDQTGEDGKKVTIAANTSSSTQTITVDGDITVVKWTNAEIPVAELFNVTFDGTPATLTAGTDFDVYATQGEAPALIKEEGRYTVVFQGKGNFTGTVTKTVDVKKELSEAETTTGIHFDIPAQLMVTTSFDPASSFEVKVTDAKSHATLYNPADYTLKFFSDETEANKEVTTSGSGSAITSITAEGKYWVVAEGVAPKYMGRVKKAFYVVKDYQTYESTKYTDVSLYITDPGYPIAETSPTGEVVKGKMIVGAKTGAAVATDAKRVFVPGTHTVTVTDNIIFDVVGIKDAAFSGCNTIRFIDARAIQDYIPSSLDRSSAGTPFKGLPRQTLVYLTGATVEGENYIYDTTTDLRCETFKIYDDNSGKQTGFGSDAAAKWDMEIPDGFTAYTIVNTRTLNATVSNKQQGYTVCLPYALPIPESFKAYTLSYSKTDQFGFTEVTTDELAAMTPYVLIPSVSGQPFGTTDAAVSATISYGTDWTYTPCTSVASAAYSGQTLYKLEGTMQYKTGTTDYYIMQANNVWDKCKATDYPNPCVLSMRAYMVANGTAASRLYSVFTNADGSTTSISNLQLDSDAQPVIYDLQGRKVSNPQRGGLYIVNGKKQIVK